MFGRFIGAGYLFYLLFSLPSALSQAYLVPAWWTPISLLAIFGTGLALGAVTFHPDIRWVGRLATANAVAYLAVVALWWPAWTGAAAVHFTSSWQALFPGVAALSAAIVWRPRIVVGYLVVVVVLVQCTNFVLLNAGSGYLIIPELAFALTFCAVFAAAALMAVRTGRVLDDTIESTHAAVAAAAAAEARAVERERFDALVHDQVMSTLLGAGRGGATGSLAAQAARAIATFDALRKGCRTETGFGVDQVLAHFRSAASDVDENVTFTAQESGTAVESGSARGAGEHTANDYPPEPVRAMAAALAEAVRNSMRHAGPGTSRAVHVDVEPAALRVTVTDDGEGFEPDTIGAHRMGIRASIRGRMTQLEGGDAAVVSAPGAGTIVALTWMAPPGPARGRTIPTRNMSR